MPCFITMWFTSDKVPEGAGTLEDVIVKARQKYNDVEMQAKYIKTAIELIRRDQGDEVKVGNFVYAGYEGVITMFPSGGEVFAHWELYDNGALEASAVEKYSPDTNRFQMLFASSSEFSEPILPRIMNM